MNIAIICSPGFGDIDMIDAIILDWMTINNIWLVSVICGDPNSAGAKWANRRGAPAMHGGVWEADFIFAFDTNVDYTVKNFVSQMKNKGKHGKYVPVQKEINKK